MVVVKRSTRLQPSKGLSGTGPDLDLTSRALTQTPSRLVRNCREPWFLSTWSLNRAASFMTWQLTSPKARDSREGEQRGNRSAFYKLALEITSAILYSLEKRLRIAYIQGGGKQAPFLKG